MILNLEQVQNITRGASRIAEVDGEFNFYRFNEKQTAFYNEVSPRDFYVKAFSTASVCLDFYTDSKSFSFDYSVEHSTGRRFYYFDVFVDGIMVTHLGEPNAWIKKGSISVNLDDVGAPEWVKTKHKNYRPEKDGEHRVSVWLPNLSKAKLFNIKIDDGASLRKAEPKKNILVYGDSITQGYDAVAPSMSYINRMARHFDANVRNLAIGGEKFVPGILDPELNFTPDFITIAYGTNDWSARPREEFTAGCDEFLSKLAEIYPNTVKFMVLPLWRGDYKAKKKFEGTFGEASTYIRNKAEELGYIVFDGWNYLPHVPDFFSDERLHPNDMGFAEYASGLIADIEQYI